MDTEMQAVEAAVRAAVRAHNSAAQVVKVAEAAARSEADAMTQETAARVYGGRSTKEA